MSRDRDAGFLHADIDTNLLSDPKLVLVAKGYRDPVKTAAAASLYLALILGSWRQGERITINEAAPAWWLDPVDDIAVPEPRAAVWRQRISLALISG